MADDTKDALSGQESVSLNSDAHEDQGEDQEKTQDVAQTPKAPRILDADALAMIRQTVEEDRKTKSGEVKEVRKTGEVDQHATAAEPSVVEARPTPAAPSNHRITSPKMADRWADLRVAPPEPDPPPEEDGTMSAGEAPEVGQSNTNSDLAEEPSLSPIEKIRARQSGMAGTPRRSRPSPEAEEAYVPFDAAAFGPTGTMDDPREQQIYGGDAPAAASAPDLDPVMAPDPDDLEGPPQPRNFIERTNPDAPRNWDSINDHTMSSKGKRVWQVAIYGTLIAVPTALFALSPFSPADTVKHHVSALGCQFGAMFGYENAKEGEPGYHKGLDEDADGIACEVKRQRLTASGTAGFKRP